MAITRRTVSWRGVVPAPVLVLLLLVLPWALPQDDYMFGVLARALVLGILALSVEVAWGFTGIFTLGQAVFFGLGAYTTGLLATRGGVLSLPVLLLSALAVGAVTGALLGIFLFNGRRVSELYVALSTLALAYAAERLANGWDAVGAANGIPSIPLPQLAGRDIEPGLPTYLTALALFALTLFLVVFVVRSQLGLAMRAVRDDEERAEFFGYRRALVQVVVFTFSGALAAMSGGLFGLTEGFVSPTLIGVTLSTSVVLWVVLGGRGTVYGPLIGLTLLEVVGRRVQDDIPQGWPVVVGVLLLLFILYLPGGLWQLGDRARGWIAGLRRNVDAGGRGGQRPTAVEVGEPSACP
jgi:branched-chain amino acid transport system permease protein